MHPLWFFSFLILTIISALAIARPLPGAVLAILFIFFGLPLLDWLIGESTSKMQDEQEKSWKRHYVWAPALYLYALTHFFLLFFAFHEAQNQNWQQVLLSAVILGIYTGGVGITVAHELCHKKEWFNRRLADLILCSVWYQHFAIEHVKGHHLRVATNDDPASARKNETAYAFLLRSIKGSFIHALELDPMSASIGSFLSILMTIFCAFVGTKVLVLFVFQAIVAIILLELVNYIEHYGLSRRESENGRFEKVSPKHSWNSSHTVSNLLLFNLQKHSDHHALAHLPYPVLKHHENVPQLPTGYPGMILLALFPTLWFKKMNLKLENFNQASF